MAAQYCSRFRLLGAIAVFIAFPIAASAQTFTASDTASLLTAISGANASGGTIVLTGPITLTSALPTIGAPNASITIDGQGFTLSGNNQFQGLTLNGSVAAGPASITIQNLTIQNTLAAGGNGANGAAGGGGGMGAGGAIFVGANAAVTVSNVNVISNAAVGGAGGVTNGPFGATGGDGGGLNGGTGGGPGASFVFFVGQPGGYGGGGGGASGASGPTTGGVGGFGGGGGGSTDGSTLAGGFGGGSNNGTTSGGGGGGLGGALFVASGGTINIAGAFTVNGNSVTPGAGGSGAASGSAIGSGLFLDGFGTLSVSGGGNATIADSIADRGGSINGGSWGLSKSGTGTLTLSGTNAYTGGTQINAGTISVSSSANLGTGYVQLEGGATLAMTATSTYSNTAFLRGNTIFSVSPGQTATWSGPVSNVIDSLVPGALNVTGGGTLVLGNTTNSYSGGTGVFGNSTLSISTDGALGSSIGGITLGDSSSTGTLAITTNGAFASARSISLNTGGGIFDISTPTNATLFGSIGGAGGLTKNGSGFLTLAGANTYGGATVVNAGTVIAANTTAFGSAPSLAIASGATVDFSGNSFTLNSLSGGGNLLLNSGAGLAVVNTATSTFSGSISGTGGLFKSGTGTLALTGTNSYQGGTTVSQGVLLGSSNGIQGTVVNNASVVFDQSTTGMYAGSMSGTGSLTKAGGGTLTLSGSNSYSGGTSIVGGTLRAGSANAFGSGAMSIGAGTTLDLNGFNYSFGSLSGSGALALTGGAKLGLGAGTFGGSLSGSGGIVKNGSGTLTLTGLNSYTGGTTVNGGVLLGNASSIQGNLVNNASVVFDQSGTGTYAGSMSGTGSLTKSGAGTLTLSGTNSYSGGTLISAGTLIGNSSSLQGSIVNNGALVFDQSGIGAFNGTISGSGSVTKSGTGTLTVGGANPFKGTLSINQGTLALDGTFAGDVNIAQGASLQGAGTIGGSLNLFGTVFVPAASTALAQLNAMRFGVNAIQGTTAPSLFIAGNLTANPGSTLQFTVTPTGVAPIAVNGTATLNGALVNVAVNDPNPARYNTYIGLTAASLTAAGLDAISPTPGIVPVLKSDPNNLYVTVLNTNIPLGGVVTSPNAAGVGGAIDRVKPGATGDLGLIVRELTALDNTALNRALGQISGELQASELRLNMDDAALITDVVRQAIDDRDNEDDGAKHTFGLQSMRWWFQLTGEHAHFSPGGFDNANANAGGGGGGFDFRPLSGFTVGGGGSFSLADMSMLGLGGSSNMQAPRAFGYGGYSAGPFMFNGGTSISRFTYTTKRPISFQATIPSVTGEQPLSGGINREADSDQVGITKDTWTEWKDTFKRGTWTYSWKLGWRATSYQRDPFTETGAGALSLTGLTQILHTKEADLTINAFRRSGTWRPRMYVSYKRQLGDLSTDSTMQIGDVAAGQFIVHGVPIPQDEFHGIFGLTFRSGLGLEYTIEYETRRAKDENHDGVHFRVRFK